MLLKLGVGVLALTLSAGATVIVALEPYGLMTVDISEDDVSFRAPIPLGLVALAVHFIPQEELEEIRRELSQIQPVIEAALDGLVECEDGTFVDVLDGDDHVRVAKEGDHLRVEVDSDDERFHFRIPLEGTRKIVHTLLR